MNNGYNWNNSGMPMQNPQPNNYGNPNQYNPYGSGQNMGMNPQQFQQPQIRKPMIPGMLINNQEDIVPNEVPMDGSVALFMTRDFSRVYAKAWNQNGSIDTVTFVPEAPPQPQVTEPTPDPFQSEILSRLDNLEKLLTPKPTAKKSDTKTE